MIEVRIRHADQPVSESRVLTTWPVDDLDGLLGILGEWGGVIFDGDQYDHLSGQFILTHRGASFEVVLADDDAE